jgi:hypothetical protein
VYSNAGHVDCRVHFLEVRNFVTWQQLQPLAGSQAALIAGTVSAAGPLQGQLPPCLNIAVIQSRLGYACLPHATLWNILRAMHIAKHARL